MPAYVVFTRTKTVDQNELEKYPNAKAAKDYREAYQTVAKHRKHGAIYHGLVVEGVS